MELFLRSLKSITILRVTGDVSSRELDILSIGLREKAPKSIPLILDFEKSKFQKYAAEKIEDLLAEVAAEGIKPHIVSTRLGSAYARSLGDALKKMGHSKADVVLEVMELDSEIRELKKRENAARAGLENIHQGQSGSVQRMLEEMRMYEWLVQNLEKIREKDQTLFRKFHAEVHKKDPAEVSVAEVHAKTLKFLKERKVIS